LPVRRWLAALVLFAAFRSGGAQAAGEGVIWRGTDPALTVERLSAHAGPIVWFSPDEPLLHHQPPGVVDLPGPFPFEPTSTSPVVYYRVRTVGLRPGAGNGFRVDARHRGRSLLDLRRVTALSLDYFFYYPFEVGGGAHEHDVESVEMKLVVEGGAAGPWRIVLRELSGKAHGVVWYDNVLEVDEFTRLPAHVLIEEGKHATATDQNGDGVFTPGVDVNRRINDAWGVRDIYRAGLLFTGGYEAWMTKRRQEPDRVFPPLPADSPLRTLYPVYPPGGAAIYELRPFPGAELAPPDLRPFITSKGDPDWPELFEDTDVRQVAAWLAEDPLARTLSLAYRYDGESGLSLVLPLLIVRAVNDPLSGGWLTNRIYLKDLASLRGGWTIQYSASASRWVDGYIAGGVERFAPDAGGWEAIAESGIKFRARIRGTPLDFLAVLTDFWGLRVGLRTAGFFPVTRLGYVIEVGAGAF
jgi:hypothetical protein